MRGEVLFHQVMSFWAAANGVLFGLLAIRALNVRRAAVSSTVRALAVVTSVVASTFVLGSIQRVGLQMVEAGWLHQGFRDGLLDSWQLLITVIATAVAIVMLARLREVLVRIDRGERVVAVLTDRVAMAPAVSDWGLTARELEVLEMIGEGVRSDDAIAQALSISPLTAATHVRNILRKGGLHNRNDLMFVVRKLDV